MSIVSLGNVLKIFGGGKLEPEAKQALFKEVALLTLARATASDTNIKEIEVEETRAIIERLTRESVSVADVRVAASSKIYETAPLDKYLTKTGSQLDVADRVSIVNALADVILVDKRVTDKEIDFFNMVAKAFDLTPAALVGLIESP